MVAFHPDELPPGSTEPFFEEEFDEASNGSAKTWVPMCSHACTFGPGIFEDKMMNLIRNPNLNSSWLFRADILYDDHIGQDTSSSGELQDAAPTTHDADSPKPVECRVRSMGCHRTLIRKLIPRNERRDDPLEQTCSFYRSNETESPQKTLVIYIPHVSSSADLPFYHPNVLRVGHLHEWDPATSTGKVSVHFLPYPEHPLEDLKLQRTAYHLLQIVHKHGHSTAAGYVKRVHHDVVIPQPIFQNRYALLKSKYARDLTTGWAESTDPQKHVFEDLGIAAFLLELWAVMYADTPFPGFVDIGCGNGLLVYILIQEGYTGWGFDARERKSWAQYKSPTSSTSSGSSLEERLLLPQFAASGMATPESEKMDPNAIHNGVFPPGTFIVSNHADELTPWTPILAAASKCPFIMIPCCSHSLSGDKYRAPPPRDKSKSKSTFSSLVDWVTHIAEGCGWEVETEMLRIPSTRNTCLLGRKRTEEADEVDIKGIIGKYGGAQGYYDNVAKLLKAAAPRSH